MNKPLALLGIAALAAITSCKKDEPSGVPVTGVDFTINVNLPEYQPLQVPGGWVYLTGGSLGLIVYRPTVDQFVALDRHCPFQPQDLCRVVVDESEVMARDTTCCHSAYLILDGSVVEGPTQFGLKQYNTMFNGTTLRIYE